MAIVRKPKGTKVLKESEIKALIHKGGSTSSEQTRRKGTPTPLLLRIPTDILDQVDSAVATRQLKTPRHTWILEAILEKLRREDSTL